ncbi:MAG: CooT family nickel-binding protein [Oscillospiraceae bacterium]|jgi:predicted RNA-binding protein|nr:CooT family nickel-binding protein [Oscillospiraceae bacterium]
MCLSTAYKGEKSPENILMKNVTSVSVDGGDVVLTDLLDNEIRVGGSLVRADLINGYVLISPDLAERDTQAAS